MTKNSIAQKAEELRKPLRDLQREMQSVLAGYREREKQLIAEYNEEAAELRPEYPTEEHKKGIARVASLVHSDTPYGNHLGFPLEGQAPLTTDRSVEYSSRAQRINVYAKAPYTAVSGGRVWEFSQDDEQTFRDLFKEHHLRVVRYWYHEDGIGFIIASTKV